VQCSNHNKHHTSELAQPHSELWILAHTVVAGRLGQTGAPQGSNKPNEEYFLIIYSFHSYDQRDCYIHTKFISDGRKGKKRRAYFSFMDKSVRLMFEPFKELVFRWEFGVP
jgi:hypothetical protein